MKVVIDIPEVRYKQILDENHTIEHYLEEAVRHSEPLPKNCGRLVDISPYENFAIIHDDGRRIHYLHGKDIPTIIEAERENSDGVTK